MACTANYPRFHATSSFLFSTVSYVSFCTLNTANKGSKYSRITERLFSCDSFGVFMVGVSCCRAGSSLPHMGSNFLDPCPCFCSSLHWLTSCWPHLALPAHVSIHLRLKLLSLACQLCFISHQVKQGIICYQGAVPRKVWNHFMRFHREMSRQQFQHGG